MVSESPLTTLDTLTENEVKVSELVASFVVAVVLENKPVAGEPPSVKVAEALPVPVKVGASGEKM